MKAYLNKQERDDMMTMLSLSVQGREITEAWGRNMTKEEKKCFKTAATWAEKGVSMIAARMDDRTAKAMLRGADTLVPVWIPKESTTAYKKRIERELKGEGVWCREDALADLSEMALYACNPCKYRDNPKMREECPGKDVFAELGIPYFDQHPEEGVCPYAVTEG